MYSTKRSLLRNICSLQPLSITRHSFPLLELDKATLSSVECMPTESMESYLFVLGTFWLLMSELVALETPYLKLPLETLRGNYHLHPYLPWKNLSHRVANHALRVAHPALLDRTLPQDVMDHYRTPFFWLSMLSANDCNLRRVSAKSAVLKFCTVTNDALLIREDT